MLTPGGNRIILVDGDGAMLMHMGGIFDVAGCPNILHILLNNGVHDSVGGQAISNPNTNFFGLAKVAKYNQVICCKALSELQEAILLFHSNNQNMLIEMGAAIALGDISTGKRRVARHAKSVAAKNIKHIFRQSRLGRGPKAIPDNDLGGLLYAAGWRNGFVGH